jgi:hypothetical protein
MKVHCTIGPTLSALRPVKHQQDLELIRLEQETQQKRADFPVYPDIVDRLLQARGDSPNCTARHVTAVLSAWSYSDLDTVAEMMARLGLFENRCLFAEVANHALLVRSTACLVQSQCRRVTLLVYRGTDPFDLATWAVSSDVQPSMVPLRDNEVRRTGTPLPLVSGSSTKEDGPRVHGGFYRNQRATWFALTRALQRAAQGQSILTPQQLASLLSQDEAAREREMDARWENERDRSTAIFMTGHSLGGAMANIAAYKLASDPNYGAIASSLAQVYTFAQPMVGNRAFKKAWDELPSAPKLFCHVHQHDVVPHLPPADTFEFVHVGTTFRSLPRTDNDPRTPDWKWGDTAVPAPVQASSWTNLIGSFVEFLGVQLPVLGGALSAAYEARDAVESGTDRLLRFVRRLPLVGRVASHVSGPDPRYSIYDHLPSHYVAASQPDGVLTEFGDDF